MSKKVLVVGEGRTPGYHRPFEAFGEECYESEILWTDDARSVSLVLFTGGADISPALYGQEAGRATSTAPKRDIFEMVTYIKARSLGLRLVGVCRGAQFLNVMAGGDLIQHVNNHTSSHPITTIDGEEFEVSSTHHQMIRPPSSAVVLGWSSKRKSNHYLGEDNALLPEPEREVEAVYWPSIKATGTQYHPEMMSDTSRGFQFAAEIVRKYLKK